MNANTARTILRLNTYAGDNIWQDVILPLGIDEAATERLDCHGRNDAFMLADGTEFAFMYELGRWTVVPETVGPFYEVTDIAGTSGRLIGNVDTIAERFGAWQLLGCEDETTLAAAVEFIDLLRGGIIDDGLCVALAVSVSPVCRVVDYDDEPFTYPADATGETTATYGTQGGDGDLFECAAWVGEDGRVYLPRDYEQPRSCHIDSGGNPVGVWLDARSGETADLV